MKNLTHQIFSLNDCRKNSIMMLDGISYIFLLGVDAYIKENTSHTSNYNGDNCNWLKYFIFLTSGEQIDRI